MVDKVFLVVGAGSIGTRHATNLQNLGQTVELIPYRAFDAKATERRNDVAGVVIATATPIRLDLIRLCAQMNWPFYAEKPLAWRREQIAAIYDAATPVAARSMVGFMMRYHPAVRAIALRDLSDVYSFAFEIGHDVRQWRSNWSFADSYAANPAGGGVLLDLCHELDMAKCLFPDIAVTAAYSLDHPDFARVDFATTVDLCAPGGPVGTVSMDYLSPISRRNAVLRGTRDRLDIDLLRPALRIRNGKSDTATPFPFERNDMFVQIMSDFVALAQGDTPSDNPLIPRFDRVRPGCELIAAAWDARSFSGSVNVALD